MNRISEDLDKNLKQWSERNEYLYSLLYLSWKHGIRTSACCGGHIDKKLNDPNIMFIVDEENLPYFESMIGALETIPDISANVNYRANKDIPNDSRVVLSIHCMMHNRNRTFYELANSILEKKEIKTLKCKAFYNAIVDRLHTDKSLMEEEIRNGGTVASSFNTITREKEEYLERRKKILYRMRNLLTGSKSKYDNKKGEIGEEPQVRYNKKS